MIATYRQETFLNDLPVLVHWSSGQFVNENNLDQIWIADKITHTINLLSQGKGLYI
jgi:hypothetical protein